MTGSGSAVFGVFSNCRKHGRGQGGPEASRSLHRGAYPVCAFLTPAASTQKAWENNGGSQARPSAVHRFQGF